MSSKFKQQGINSASPGDSSGDAIKLLLKNHPIFFLCFICLALYGLSMVAFYQRDKNVTQGETWIEKTDEEPKKKKTVTKVVEKKTPAPSKKTAPTPVQSKVEIPKKEPDATNVKKEKKKKKKAADELTVEPKKENITVKPELVKKEVKKQNTPFSTGTGKNDMAFEEVKGRVQNEKKQKKRSTSSGSEIDSDSSDEFVPQQSQRQTAILKKKKEAELKLQKEDEEKNKLEAYALKKAKAEKLAQQVKDQALQEKKKQLEELEKKQANDKKKKEQSKIETQKKVEKVAPKTQKQAPTKNVKKAPTPPPEEQSDYDAEYGSGSDERSEDQDVQIIKKDKKNVQYVPKTTVSSNEYQKAKNELAQNDKKKSNDIKMADKFAKIDKKKQTQAPSKKTLKEDKMAQNSLPTPDTQDLSRKNENDSKPEKGMKFKKVFQPKRTITDKQGEWEVVDAKRDTVLVQKPIYTDSEDDVTDSD